jgi:hypothetical protein
MIDVQWTVYVCHRIMHVMPTSCHHEGARDAWKLLTPARRSCFFVFVIFYGVRFPSQCLRRIIMKEHGVPDS